MQHMERARVTGRDGVTTSRTTRLARGEATTDAARLTGLSFVWRGSACVVATWVGGAPWPGVSVVVVGREG